MSRVWEYKGPLSQFGIMGLQEKNLGLWDYTLFEIRITEIRYKIGIMDLKSNQIWIFHPCKHWDYGISPYLKLGLWDYAGFEIGIMGLQDPPPMGALIYAGTNCQSNSKAVRDVLDCF